MNHWIFKNKFTDFSFLFIPGLIGIILVNIIEIDSFFHVIMLLFVLSFVDSGHVYTTLWRTFFNPKEVKSSKIYWLVPIGSFLFVFLWVAFKIPYLWPFIVYFTLFHHIRQNYGISRWYQKLNNRFSKLTNKYLYLLLFIPLVLFHFRGIDMGGYYSDNDFFMFPSPDLLFYGLILYGLVILSWIAFEIKLYKRGLRELNRFSSIFIPALLYGYVFLVSNNIIEALVPLILSHGIPYFGMMSIGLTRTRSWLHNLKVPLLIITLTALVFGTYEYFLETLFVSSTYPTSMNLYLYAALIAFYLTPLLCHFIFDAHIWTGKHREAKEIFI